MAKSDLLKEAIADAKAVKETAIANARLALEEAFTPRIQSMLSAKLSEELEDEEEEGMEGAMRGSEMRGSKMREQEDELEMGDDMADDMGDDMEGEEMGDMEGDILNVSIDDPSTSQSPDFLGDIPAAGGEKMGDMEGDEMGAEDDLDLESIIRELEGDFNEEEEEEEMMGAERGMKEGEEEAETMEEDIDAIIEAILGEEEAEELEEAPAEDGTGMDLVEQELEEAYSTIKELQSVLQEVNLLNAKLLYTNKLFRNFELSENQKMKVIENFDRAGNTREVKLVFSTLAESFQKPATKKSVVKEHKNVASKAVGTTKPAKEIISEGNEMAARFKKLAGLL
jgi:hypothetical protein